MSERDISVFKQAFDEMISKSEDSWNDLESNYFRRTTKLKDYSLSDADEIINGTSLVKQIRLSSNYYLKDGFYKRLILHYATLLKYVGILIPNPSFGQTLSTKSLQKRYFSAVNYIEKLDIPVLLTRIAIRTLVEGRYYGVIQKLDREDFILLDLPSGYCSSEFKDLKGHDLIQFDVSYFNTISNKKVREIALKNYPAEVQEHYKKYQSNHGSISKWVFIPPEIGICFSFYSDGRPLFLNVIPSAIQYEEAVEVERARQLNEINKIIVQHIPHTNDGLVFEPPEAKVMHDGAVKMLKGKKNISVLTSYADISDISSSTSDKTNDNLERMLENIYSEASASSQIFSPTGNFSVETSLENDLALMLILANKFSNFVSFLINTLFANTYIDFTYKIMPVSNYNVSDYITDSLKMAQSGYSLLLPAMAIGMSQRDLMNIKQLENNVLKLQELLIPPQNSYTTSGEAAVPVEEKTNEKDIKDKSPKTIENEKSIDNTGGSN